MSYGDPVQIVHRFRSAGAVGECLRQHQEQSEWLHRQYTRYAQNYSNLLNLLKWTLGVAETSQCTSASVSYKRNHSSHGKTIRVPLRRSKGAPITVKLRQTRKFTQIFVVHIFRKLE